MRNLRSWVISSFLVLALVANVSAGGILHKGEPAPEDCRWFSLEETRRLTENLRELEVLKQQLELNEQIIKVLKEQVRLLEESNRILTKRNEQLVKELNRKEKWDSVKRVLNTILMVGLIVGTAYVSK